MQLACSGVLVAARELEIPQAGSRLLFKDGQLAAYADRAPAKAWPEFTLLPEQGTTGERWPATVPVQQSGEVPIPLPPGMIPALTGPTPEEERAFYIGEPLEEQSWLDTRHSAGPFMGIIGGATPIENRLDQGAGGLFGLRLGYDYDYRWGIEKRFGFAQMDVRDIHDHHRRQVINLELGDLDLLFYPWGDTRWRPYMMAGVGLAHFNFESETHRRIDRLLMGLPFGMGVKYFWHEGLSLRADLVDNLMLGAHEVSTMNNLSLALGAEFRYAGIHWR